MRVGAESLSCVETLEEKEALELEGVTERGFGVEVYDALAVLFLSLRLSMFCLPCSVYFPERDFVWDVTEKLCIMFVIRTVDGNVVSIAVCFTCQPVVCYQFV